MDKPTDGIEDVDMDSGTPSSLQEGDNVSEENSSMAGVVAFITEKYNKSSDSRQTDEERWLKAYRNYRGIYGPDTQFTDSEKSKAFIKITKTKVLAAYNQVVDVLFAGSSFPIGIENPPNPMNIEDAVSFDQQPLPEDATPKRTVRPDVLERVGKRKELLEPVENILEPKPGVLPTSITYEPAKEMARLMQKQIHEQLEETEASKHLRQVAFEMSLFGTGILKGPFLFEKEYPKWNEDGEYDPEVRNIPKIEHVSIWDFYPDPDSRSMVDAEYVIQRHRLNRTQLRSFKKRPHFREESIELAIEMGENYTNDYWEETLQIICLLNLQYIDMKFLSIGALLTLKLRKKLK